MSWTRRPYGKLPARGPMDQRLEQGLEIPWSHFMQQAASAGVAEVQLGQLALTRSDNDAVKALAQRIVDDHEKAVKLFSAEAAASGDSRLRQFVQATLPALRAHLQSAKQLTAVSDARTRRWSMRQRWTARRRTSRRPSRPAPMKRR